MYYNKPYLVNFLIDLTFVAQVIYTDQRLSYVIIRDNGMDSVSITKHMEVRYE